MGLISSIEQRASVNDPNMWLGTLLESPNFQTKSGVSITADTALKISTVYACVTILAQSIASLPMTINKALSGGGNEVAKDHCLYPLLHDSFNSILTSFEARELGVGHLKLKGNWFNYLERNRSGQILGIYPLEPSYIQVYRQGKDLWHEYQPPPDDPVGKQIFSPIDMWHIKGFSKDGITGLSTVAYARESMGLSQALQDFSATFFGNKAVPGAILEHPNALSAQAKQNLKASLEAYATSKKHTTLILEEGMKWNSVAISNSDAQYLEISQAQVKDIARWFHIPLALLQESDNTSTYASVEQLMLSFVVHTLSPDIVRIEQSANRALLTEKERKAGYYIKINVKGLLRGDFATRMNGYRVAREGGWYSVNDIRALEDESPIENGDIYLQPLNYKEAGAEDEPAEEGNGEGNQVV